MELVRKIGLWIVAAMIVAAAGVVYFTAVSRIGKKVDEEVEDLKVREDKLGVWARKRDEIPNDEWIKEAKIWAERVNDELDNCALFLAVQPLDSYRRSFYRNERVGVDKVLFHEISRDLGKYEWTNAYAEHCATLKRKIDERPEAAFGLQTKSWPTLLPTDEEITKAMEMFWIQKELADRLSDLVERDLNEMLAPNREAGVFPGDACDLVVARGETELDVPLRSLDQAKLIHVAEAILLNDEEIDLATIFDKYLADPEDEKNDFSWARVYSLTTSEEQRRFLAGLVGDPKDYFNRQRFVDYVMELRSVRYRTDVADLLEREGGEFAKVGTQLRNMTKNDRIVLKAVMQRWNRTRLAQTIAAVVAIRNEEDYKIVRDNHDPRVASVASLQITQPYGQSREDDPSGRRGSAGRTGIRAAKTAQSENYLAWPVTMTIRIEFERIPILIRRLLTSSMRFRLFIESIVPVAQRDVSRADTPAGRLRVDGRGSPTLRGTDRTARAPAVPPAFRRGVGPSATDNTAEEELKVLRNYAEVVLSGEGYQFAPLREKFQDQLDDKGQEMPSPTPAPEPDAGRTPTAEGTR